jgi:dipeptide/tripeptide permease
VFWWLFQGFEQSIKSFSREHVHFIDDVNFEARLQGNIFNSFPKLSYLIYTPVRSSINFYHIQRISLLDSPTTFAFPTRLRSYSFLAVNCHSQKASSSGFSYPSRSTKKIGMMKSFFI